VVNDFRPRWHKSIQPLVEAIKSLSLEEQTVVLKTALDSFKRGNAVNFYEKDDTASLESKLSTRIKTLEDLLEKSNVDQNVWEVERHIINKWEVGTKIDDRIVVEELFQVKCWLKKNTDYLDMVQIKEDILEEIFSYSPVVSLKEFNTLLGSKGDTDLQIVKNESPHILEINIFDLHFGKLAYDYDTNVAKKRFIKALEVLVNRASNFHIERIVFPVGNDFFNSDSLRNETTKGTAQDEHLLWHQTVKLGRQLIVEGIEYLNQFAPVDVIVVQGNHDWERSFYLGEMLEAYYNKNENVSINNDWTPRKYYKYGNCLIGYTHGNNEKVADLPLIMAQENSKDWSNTKYREFHLGHLHHKREIKYKSTQEYKGIVIRYMRSLSGDDLWHNLKGYVGTQHSSEAFVWSKKNGLVAEYSFNL
jgi:hypothetical protein